jgi:xylulose-5-phosphate/fructose-6-phosphate phosphoketolase
LATAYHSNKFLNPLTDCVVLPILHLNGYKISNPTILARISHEKLEQLFMGDGWTPYFVAGDNPALMHEAMTSTLEKVITHIQQIKSDGKANSSKDRRRWPMIVLRSPKGWSAERSERL